MARPTINTNCVADRHADRAREKIIEFRAGDKGGLISFYQHDNGTVTISIYRTDEGVSVVCDKNVGVRR